VSERKRTSLNLQTNLLAGFLTIIPLLVVWFVFDFLFNLLSEVGRPVANALTVFLDQNVPALTPLLHNPYVEWIVAVLAALIVLYTIGAAASRVIGLRIISYFERLIQRIPIVETIYSATKKLVAALQQKPDGVERVVLIEFPHPAMHALGLVMKTFSDATTGAELAAVYVPTTPNPTSGYLEIVPVKDLIATDLTLDQAMTMIVSGGAIGPDRLTLQRRERKA